MLYTKLSNNTVPQYLIFSFCQSENLPPEKDKKILVFHKKLMDLFKVCHEQVCTMDKCSQVTRIKGRVVHVNQSCATSLT